MFDLHELEAAELALRSSSHSGAAPLMDANTDPPAGTISSASATAQTANTNTHASLAQLLPKGSDTLPSLAGKPSDRNHAAPFIDMLKRNLELQPGLKDAQKLIAVTKCFPSESATGACLLASSRILAPKLI